jgi:hypothetical protein
LETTTFLAADPDGGVGRGEGNSTGRGSGSAGDSPEEVYELRALLEALLLKEEESSTKHRQQLAESQQQLLEYRRLAEVSEAALEARLTRMEASAEAKLTRMEQLCCSEMQEFHRARLGPCDMWAAPPGGGGITNGDEGGDNDQRLLQIGSHAFSLKDPSSRPCTLEANPMLPDGLLQAHLEAVAAQQGQGGPPKRPHQPPHKQI